MRKRIKQIDWDVPALIVGVLGGGIVLTITQVGQDWWIRRTERAGSLAQAIQSSHDKSQVESALALSVVLAFALTSAVARRQRLLWGLVPLGMLVIGGAFMDARLNHEADWSDDLTALPVLGIAWLISSGLVTLIRLGIDTYRGRHSRPPTDDPSPDDKTETWPPPPAL